jgi:hypothetical protein
VALQSTIGNLAVGRLLAKLKRHYSPEAFALDPLGSPKT